MDKVPRAVGRMVVCVEDSTDARTATTISQPQGPSTTSFIARKTSSWLASLPSPIPSVPTVAYIITSRATET